MRDGFGRVEFGRHGNALPCSSFKRIFCLAVDCVVSISQLSQGLPKLQRATFLTKAFLGTLDSVTE